MAKFDNAKVGDIVFSTVYGWGKVFSVDKTDVHFPLVIEFDKNIRMCYRSDGTTNGLDKFPNLYWNEVKLPTEEEDKKPFDLVNFLRESLKVKKFIKNEDNYYLIYHHKTERLEQQCNAYAELDGVCFNFISIAVMEKLNKEKITIDQLKQAYKTLGWL